ncbi:MAG: hypothetical protein K1X88_32705 [Nannocystaceae bacterium]|nr:hypothetical protein [Nannocystaceae bacterium]
MALPRRAAVIALALVAGGAPAPSRVAFELPDRDLFPEGIAWDRARGTVFVGSLRQQRIVARERDGTWRSLGDDAALGAVLGLEVDTERRALWAVHCFAAPGEGPALLHDDPARRGETGVVRFDLDGGAVTAFTATPAPPGCLNDLEITRDGAVVVTAGDAGLWRLPPGGDTLAPWLRDAPGYANGIASTADGTKLVVAIAERGLAAVDPQRPAWRMLATPAGAELRGIDGLVRHGDDLLAVRNGTDPAAVLRIVLGGDARTITAVEVLEAGHPRHAVPTTAAVVDDALFYVATSQLDRIDRRDGSFDPTTLVPTTILALPLHDDARGAGGCLHRR